MANSSPAPRGDGASAAGSPGGAVPVRSPVSAGDIVAGKYRIGAVVGFQGMGIVCEGVHVDLGTTVAVVFAHPDDAIDERAVSRFLSGARSAAQLRSQHARRVLDCGRLEGGAPYMVLESLDGADLRGIVTTHGSLPVEETLGFVLQACEALGEAHARGLAHCDVRSENLFLTRGPDGGALIKVLGLEFSTQFGNLGEDRGLSDSLDDGEVSYHLSPEQMTDPASVDARADVWSLGVLLYELLTGALPFGGDSVSQVRVKVMVEQPRSPRVLDSAISKGLAEVVLRCLEKNPDTRFPDAATLGHALRAFGGSTSSMSGARVEDVLRHARSIRPERDTSPSITGVPQVVPAPPLPRSIPGLHSVSAPKVPSVPSVVSAGSPPGASAAVTGPSDSDASEEVRPSWLMDQPAGPENAPESSDVESSEESVRPSWLMDPPAQENGPDASQAAPAPPRSAPVTSPSVTTPPPMPVWGPSVRATLPLPSTSATTKPPPMPATSQSVVATLPQMPVVSPPALATPLIPEAQPSTTTKPPPMPVASSATTESLPAAAASSVAPAASLVAPAASSVTPATPSLPAATSSVAVASSSPRTPPPPLPSLQVPSAAVISAWVVKNQRVLIAAGGGFLVVLMIVLILPSKSEPTESSTDSPAPTAKAAATPNKPAVRPSATPVARDPSPVSATPVPAEVDIAPAASARAQESPQSEAPAPAVSSRTKRPKKPSLYPVLKPPSF